MSLIYQSNTIACAIHLHPTLCPVFVFEHITKASVLYIISQSCRPRLQLKPAFDTLFAISRAILDNNNMKSTKPSFKRFLRKIIKFNYLLSVM